MVKGAKKGNVVQWIALHIRVVCHLLVLGTLFADRGMSMYGSGGHGPLQAGCKTGPALKQRPITKRIIVMLICHMFLVLWQRV